MAPKRKPPTKKAPAKKSPPKKAPLKKAAPKKAAKATKAVPAKKPAPKAMKKPATAPEKKKKTGGAPKGNQFWKLRAKHGRDKLLASPELLWQSACAYFQWCDDNPLLSVEYYGKDAMRCEVPKMRAYTWSGLEHYLDIYSLRDYKTNETYKDFSPVITRIEKIIYTQKFEGAAAGFLNASIIARDLGLRDGTDLTTGGDKIKPAPALDLSGVPLELLKEFAKYLDDTEAKG